MSDALRTVSSAYRSTLGRLGLLGSREGHGPGGGLRGSLFRKYVLLLVGLVGFVLLVNAGLHLSFSYGENKTALFRIQQEKAASAARQIEEFADDIERQLGWTTAPQWAAASVEQRRFDYVRLLRQAPAITELIQLDDTGKEQLKVSRLAMDVVGSGKDYSQSPAFIEAKKHRMWFGPVYFRKESEPYMTIAMAQSGRNAGVTVAEVNLKLIWDVINGLKIGESGYAYVVDRGGRLIADPDISLVLRNTDLSNLPQVAAALSEISGGAATTSAAMVAKGLDGKSVLTAHAAIPPLGWTVFVEVPLKEAMAPLYGTLLRSTALLALSLGLAALAALLLARRMVGPIRQLQAGAARIGAGELDRRIEIHTGDELEELAGTFNGMAGDLQKSYAELEKKVEERTAELKEALDQQTATAEVLGVINSSPGDLAPVFDAMLDKALDLCEAAFGTLWTFDGECFHAVALRRVPAGFAELLTRAPYRPEPGSGHERLLRGAPYVQIHDAAAQASIGPVRRALVELGGARTVIAVPLLKDGAVLGAISAFRQEVRPFTEKQIALLQSFAAQAVIAMENARLLTETREALERQTATAEILRVISSSPTNVQPTFDAIAAAAKTLTDGALGGILTYDGKLIHVASAAGWAPDELAKFRPLFPIPANRDSLAGRAILTREIAHIADMTTDTEFHPSLLRSGGRTALAVPMLRDGVPIGAINVQRRRVEPFSEAQIDLLRTFADQAVIAIENVRLFNETREALEQQTATAEVLGVINSSPGDLAPVFDAILEKAHTLCGAAHGSLQLYDGEKLHAVATHAVSDKFADILRQGYRAADSPASRALIEGEPFAHIADCAEIDHPVFRGAAELAGIHTVLFVPLRKDRAFLGLISAARLEVRPFSEKEIALLQNFAAQAVIAMENARLLTETREALEQQTATADVLQVINSSPGDLAPVFDAILEKAHTLCGAAHGGLNIYDGERFRNVAAHAIPPRFAELMRQPFHARRIQQRLLRGERYVHVPDMMTSTREDPNDPIGRASDEAGIRTLLVVPLRKDGVLLGYITAHREEVRPFSDKQIALLENFAAQAVIAMENARLITETREALEQQTATAEVLQVINSSPGDLAPVFEAILEKAHTLCGAAKGALTIYDGEHFRAVATRGVSEEYAALLRAPQYSPPGSPPQRLLDGESIVQIPDIGALPFPIPVAAAGREGVRTVLHIPLRKDGALLGYITAYRQEVRPFSEKQIALLQNFAAQAVIAMENARLITETREALEQQTATAEVLRVINSSPGDLAPVFEAILEKAHALCGAAKGSLVAYDGNRYRTVASRGLSPAYAKLLRELRRDPGRSSSPFERLLRGESLVQISDLRTENDQISGAAAQLEGARTVLFVPLRKDGALLGYMTAYRQEVRPFSDKQIALLQNFAAQAVIAMENARLITETREALEQQTATAEVLQVINSSPGDLTPVFDAMLDKAIRLSEATHSHLFTYDGDLFHLAAAQGELRYIEWQRQAGPIRPYPSSALGQIKRGQRIVHVADIREEEVYRALPIFREQADLRGVRSEIAVALTKDNVLLGAMVVYRQEVRPFSDKQIALLQNFAAQAVIAMENARLITETREALERQTATAEVLQVINSSPGDLAPVFDAMLEKALVLCEAVRGQLATFDGEFFEFVALKGDTGWVGQHPRGRLLPSRGLTWTRIVNGEPFVQIADAQDTEYYRSGQEQAQDIAASGGRTFLSVALRREHALLGVLTVYRQEVRPFSDKQIALLENFAAQAVIAMENARLLGELRQRTHDLQESLEYQTASGDVLKVISQSGGELTPVLDTLVETAAQICRADCGFIFRLQDGFCRMVAAFGIPAEYKGFQESNPIAPGRGTLAGRTALERSAVHIEDAATDPEYTRVQAVQLGHQRTMLGVPLIREDALIGVITLARSYVEPFTEKQIGQVTTFADQAVIAIENARLFNELRVRTTELGSSVAELKMLNEVAQAVSSTLDLRAVLSTVLTRSVGLTGADGGAIFRYSRAERSFQLVEAVGSDEVFAGSVRGLRVPEAETAMGEAVARREPIQIPDLVDRPRAPLRDSALAAGLHSVLIIPLVGPERVLGAIILQRRAIGEFPAETVRLMQTIASQSVLAIQNARLFREIADKSEQLALASQHKSQFLANMSHELRTPLNAILGYAELLVDGIYGVLPDRPRGVLDRIQNNGKHLLALINDVLDLAKIEAGQLTLTLEDYSLPEVVKSVVTATEPLATSKGLQFTAAVQDDMPIAHGDARRVSQVLLNLAGNAIKFTDKGEVEIRAIVDKGQFVLTVRDTGPGIADADQERIFGEFQQIDNSNTRKKGGTGLGLAISKRMVEMQGGTISVDSVLGQGSTFRVVLPVHVDEVMEEAAE